MAGGEVRPRLWARRGETACKLLLVRERHPRADIGEARATISGKTVTTQVTFADGDAHPSSGKNRCE